MFRRLRSGDRGLAGLGVLDVDPVIDRGAIRERLDEIRPGLLTLGKSDAARTPNGGTMRSRHTPGVVDLGDFRLEVPAEVRGQVVKSQGMSLEDRIGVVQQTEWAQKTAAGFCRLATGETSPECVERVSRRLAESVL